MLTIRNPETVKNIAMPRPLTYSLEDLDRLAKELRRARDTRYMPATEFPTFVEQCRAFDDASIRPDFGELGPPPVRAWPACARLNFKDTEAQP